MRADERFLNESKAFWANVRTISQALGYTVRGSRSVRVHSLDEMRDAMRKRGLGADHLVRNGRATPLGNKLREYFEHRAEVLNGYVEPRLMDVEEARELFEGVRREHRGSCPIPKNKQKREKAAPAYLTGIVNMLVERYSEGLPVDYDPKELTTSRTTMLPSVHCPAGLMVPFRARSIPSRYGRSKNTTTRRRLGAGSPTACTKPCSMEWSWRSLRRMSASAWSTC